MEKSQTSSSDEESILGTDKFGNELREGDLVFYPLVVHSKGARSEMGFSTIKGKSRGYIQLTSSYRGISPSSLVKVTETFRRAYEDGTIFKY
ncbi:gp072 [Erwinia phage vB_Eam-MM7]|uniref:Gp072 n=1 Tax=Erwinia phage vB_Eam-MM7 TaxID=1051674 RepID=G0YPQ4_9CAUD|nr:gp072 [Erwinia phage vB_Eam-MM7]AEJ81331.1 gp072 [Erwinia phage vB_Eam-MM7]